MAGTLLVDASFNSQRYFDKQRARVISDADKLAARDVVAADGRVIPDTGDLPIGFGRRVTAAVMFVDICGFSSRPSSTLADQDKMLRILAFFFAELIRIVEDYGGVVEKNTGDGLMAYFAKDGSLAHESQRAAAAAMTIFYAANMLLNPVIKNSNYEPVDFRICIDHGPITIASVGAAKRFNSFVAIGTTANIACKLLKFAGKNEIVIGEDVFSGLPSNWQVLCVYTLFETGFVRLPGGIPYPCLQFTGRWQGLRDDR